MSLSQVRTHSTLAKAVFLSVLAGAMALTTVTWLGSARPAIPEHAAAVPIGSCCATPGRAIANPRGPVVLFGDSDVERWPMPAIGDVTIINRGHSGDHVSELLARFDRDVVAERPRAVLIWGFDNDVVDARDRNLDAPGVLAAVQRAYTEMVERAERNGIEPILATDVTFARHAGLVAAAWRGIDRLLGRTEFEDRMNPIVLEGNERLRDLARSRNLLLLELQIALSDHAQYRRPEFVEPDGTHITPAGYAELTKRVLPALRAHLNDRESAP
jgi:lysophospholipase L1-like esterase